MINQTLIHYRITAKLDAGGMGEVYRATDSKLGRVKVLDFGLAKDRKRRLRDIADARVDQWCSKTGAKISLSGCICRGAS